MNEDPKCKICSKESEAEVCDSCVKRFCQQEYKGYCHDCQSPTCVKASNECICPICKREVPKDKWENHHLIPRCEKGKITARICVSCGDIIHKTMTINELRDKYNSIETICDHPKIVEWVKWISKKPNDFTVCMKHKKRK